MTNLSGANLNNGAAVGPQGEGRESPSTFPKYPAYKDSRVPWIGEVPVTWEVKPFKWLLDNNDGGVWGDDPTGEGDTLVLRSTDQTVDGNWKLTDPAPRKLSAKEKASALLVEGDLVVTKSSGSSLHIGKTTLVTADIAKQGCCYGNFMQRLRVNSSFTPKLAWYVMNNELARAQLDLLSNSTTGLANLNGTLIGEILLPVSAVAEQTQIARFLDHETGRIDALIEEQQRLIVLLKEKRQAVISHAVTKGLDPTVSMKDSGVEWLGEVPAHWKVIKLGLLASDRCDGPFGSALKSEHYTDEGVRVIRLQNIKSGWFNDADSAFIDADYYRENIGKSDVVSGDVLIAGLGDDNNPVGRACVAPENIAPAMVKADCFRFRLMPDVAASEFIALQLTAGATADAGILSTGSTRARIPLSSMSTRLIALPPVTEQQAIVSFIQRLNENIDSLFSEAQSGIALLQERRSALISAAVTGKIDVRGWQAPASTQAPELAVAETV